MSLYSRNELPVVVHLPLFVLLEACGSVNEKTALMVVRFQDFMEGYNLSVTSCCCLHWYCTHIDAIKRRYNKAALPIVLLELRVIWHLSQRNYGNGMEVICRPNCKINREHRPPSKMEMPPARSSLCINTPRTLLIHLIYQVSFKKQNKNKKIGIIQTLRRN